MYKYSKISLGLLILLVIGCNRIEKQANEVLKLQKKEITQSDYVMTSDKKGRDVYVTKDKELMTGHYFLKDGPILKKELVISGGLLDGDYKVYTDEGILVINEQFKAGRQDGKSIQYSDDGSVSSIDYWKNGKQLQQNERYMSNGNLSSKRVKEDGIWKDYDYDQGKLRTVEYTDTIQHIPMNISLLYDEFEILQYALGFTTEQTSQNPGMLYILGENFTITDSINVKNEQYRFMQFIEEVKYNVGMPD